MPLLGAVVVVAFAVALLVVRVGVAANDRARAQAAADASALAAAGADDEAALAIARENGAVVNSIERLGNEVTVEVRVGEATARASARRDHAPAATVDLRGLHPDLAAAIARAQALIGRPITITSGLRSRAEQEALWRDRRRNPFPVARPGTSAHERGLAVDIAQADLGAVLGVASQVGLCRPLPVTDPVHFRLCGDR